MLNYDPIEIIAISYFRPVDFSLCIKSVLQNTLIPFKLTIIDNSVGGIENHLRKFEEESRVRIIRNHSNMGKGASFKNWYGPIIKDSNTKYFVSLDADVIVPRGWLSGMIRSLNELNKPLGAIAPVLMHSQHDTFEHQVSKKSLTMHGAEKGFESMQQISEYIYYNVHTAGSLFLIDRLFYETIGGYPGDCLFGHDDGFICRKAREQNRFIGFTTAVSCIHSREDDSEEYRCWKIESLNKANLHNGHWD